MDDGSPDNCPAICDEYAAKDQRITLIHQKNAGYGTARNVGIRKASGEYLGFVDPDDWVEKDMLQGMSKGIAQGADIVVCDWKTYPDPDEEHGTLHSQKIDNHWDHAKIRDEFLLDHYPNFLCNKLFKKSLFAGITIPPDIVMGDLYACGEIFARSHKIVYVPEGYYCYRVHASFANTQQKTRRKYGMFMAWREHERVCAQYKLAPLTYSRQRAQKAAISLKILNLAQPYLKPEQARDLEQYLQELPQHPVDLPFKHRFQYWALLHLPGCCKSLGQISIEFDKLKQKRKFG